jgi:hypothetical protein
VDRYRFHADPDPTFHFDVVPDPNSLSLHFVEMGTGTDSPADPYRQALVADPDPAK